MKKIITLLLLIICVSGNSAFSQNLSEKKHFDFIKVSSASSKDNLLKMLNVLNLENYRLIDKRRSLEFNDGSVIELFSANELMEKYQRKFNPANKLWTPNLPNLIIQTDSSTGRPVVSEKY